jgi:glutamyl-tRNA reductase
VCGYDSLALGEYQIVGQVKEAYRIADEQKTLSKVLSRLFHKAFETSKKVRTTTEMNRGAASVSYAAVELANRTFCDLKSKRILLVGAGQTSELVVQNLKKRGCTDLRIVNRTFERAQNLAERYNGLAIDMALLQTAVAESDIVITSTGSQVALITETMVADIMAQRADLPLFFVDLSVPRNVDDRVAKIANVSVHDVDALQAVVAETFERRHSQLETGRAIINEFVVDFLSWLNTQKLQPTIKLLHDNFAEVQKAEIESFRKFNQNAASDDDLERFGERIAQQYVNHLIRNVRELTQNGQNEAYLGMLNQLFLLNKKA